MSKLFTLTIRAANAAFEGDPGAEIARILQSVADSIYGDGLKRHTQSILDLNGNRVGGWKFDEEENED